MKIAAARVLRNDEILRNGLRAWRWLAVPLLACTMAACGGSEPAPPELSPEPAPTAPGPEPAPAPAATPEPDARNGTYTVYAAHGLTYALSLDFDARSWRMAGSGLDQSGSIASWNSEFTLQPAGSAPAQSTPTARFGFATETVLGSFAFPASGAGEAASVQPFIAPREFVRSMAEAEGIYGVFSAVRPTGQQRLSGEVTDLNLRDGSMTMGSPAGMPFSPACAIGGDGFGVLRGNVTLAGDVFTWRTCAGALSFRVARVGAEGVLLLANSAPAFQHRLVLGRHQTTQFAAGAGRIVRTDGGTWIDASLPDAELTRTVGGPLVMTPEGGTTNSVRLVGHHSSGPRAYMAEDASPGGPPPLFAYRSPELMFVGRGFSTSTEFFLAFGRSR